MALRGQIEIKTFDKERAYAILEAYGIHAIGAVATKNDTVWVLVSDVLAANDVLLKSDMLIYNIYKVSHNRA